MTVDYTKIFALRLEGLCNLYRHGAISNAEFKRRIGMLPYGPPQRTAEDFQSLSDVTAKILEKLK